MRLLASILSGDTRSLAKQYEKRMQAATVAAMADVADLAKAGGRRSIAAGGFSSKWQNALRSRVYPNADRAPLSPAALVWHRISYSGIFETGGAVAGKPMLWLPLPSVPAGRGKHPLTPKQYVERVGPLKAIRAGGRPMLAGRGSRAGILRATPTRVQVRKRAVKRGSILGDWVPLFVGVPTVNIAQRFHIEREARQAAEQLGPRFAAHFTPEG